MDNTFSFISISPPLQMAKRSLLLLNISFMFLIIVSLTTHLSSPNPTTFVTKKKFNTNVGCTELHNYPDSKAKCSYIESHTGCQTGGYIAYLQLFYCTFSPPLGNISLFISLVLLFYLLGDTAANYFCSSLEGLSRTLNLSPTVAGVTLLSLGNGANDLFATMTSFMGDSTKEVGLNSILGGAFFVSSIVVGIISLTIHRNRVSIDKASFIRDVLFFLVSLLCIFVIIMFGRINLWGSISFLSVYFVYVLFVSTTEFWGKKRRDQLLEVSVCNDILPINSRQYCSELGSSLLGSSSDEKVPNLINQEEVHLGQNGVKRALPNLKDWEKLVGILELPLSLPRRFTIPVINEEKWSKSYGVISVTLAPIFVSMILSSHYSGPKLLLYLGSGSVGIIFGTLAYSTTENSVPPENCTFPWLAGGFLMSITWTYILAQELVSLLASLGLIFGISPFILGLTVLAWGNSLGDLVANLSMAMNGGPNGVKVAISGCYAGPIFNTVMGLGLSLTFASYAVYPSSYLIPTDPSVYETMGFLIGGLLWALVVLPKNNMRIERGLGVGLLVIYLCFLSLKLCTAIGWITAI